MSPSTRALTPLLFIYLLATAGCSGDTAKTTGYYRTPFVPVEGRLSRHANGDWSAGLGLATPVGTFGIEQTFDMSEEFTYLVLRDRARGTDQVFRLATKGYVEFHTQGEHRLRVDREGDKVTVEVETLSGTLDIKVYPNSEEVARVELGADDPHFVFFDDRRLSVDYRSFLWDNPSVPLDTLAKVTYRRDYRTRKVVFDWKPDVKDLQPLEVALTDWPNSEKHFETLGASLGRFAPHVKFERETNLESARAFWGALGVSGLFTLSLLAAVVYSFYTSTKRLWGCLGLVAFLGSAFGCCVWLFYITLDWEYMTSYFG